MKNKNNLITIKNFSKKIAALGLLSVAGISSQIHVKAVTAPTTSTPTTAHPLGTITLVVNGHLLPLTPTAAASYLKLMWASEWTNHGGLKTDPYYLFIKQLQVSIDPQTDIVTVVDPSNGAFSYQIDKTNSDFHLIGGHSKIVFSSIKVPVNYVYRGTNTVISGLVHDFIQIPMSANANHPLPADIPNTTPTKGIIPKYANVGTPVYDASKKVWSIPIDYPVVYVDQQTNQVLQHVRNISNVNNDKIYPSVIPVLGKRIEGTEEGWRVSGLAKFVDGRWEIPAKRISLVQYVYKGTTNRVNNSKITSIISPKNPQNPQNSEYPQNLPQQQGIIGKPVYDILTNTWNIPVEFSTVFVQSGTHNIIAHSINQNRINSDKINPIKLSIGTLVPGTTNWKVISKPQFINGRWEIPAIKQILKVSGSGIKKHSPIQKPTSKGLNTNILVNQHTKNSNLDAKNSVRGSNGNTSSKNSKSEVLFSALSVVSLIALCGRKQK